MWGSYCNVPKAIFYLLKGTILLTEEISHKLGCLTSHMFTIGEGLRVVQDWFHQQHNLLITSDA